MVTAESRSPVQAGEAAPDFALPAIERDGTVSLADYRGRSAVFLALFRGIFCPFCRRAIAQTGTVQEKLKAVGVEALGIVATTPENARLYFQFRPTRLRLAADPELITHRAYGLPKPPITPELMQQFQSVRINPTGELPHPLPVLEAAAVLDRLHPHTNTERDNADHEGQVSQLTGEFLVDRDGIVRWTRVECAKEGMAGIGKFPTEEEILAAARTLPRS
jgi:peroxiredoxin